MAETLQINELTNHQQNCCTPQLQRLAATQLLEIQCCAVIEIVALDLGFPMVQFSARNIDVSKSYGRNATDQLTHQHN
jgi:hypothetical protein